MVPKEIGLIWFRIDQWQAFVYVIYGPGFIKCKGFPFSVSNSLKVIHLIVL